MSMAGKVILTHAPFHAGALTEQQRKYALNRAQGMSTTAAMRHAGYKSIGNGTMLENNPNVRALIQKEQAKFAEEGRITRKKVLDGLLDAIQMARLQSEPMTMIAGWREIGRMSGFYEPTKHQIDISVNGKITLQKLQSMSDSELLALAESNPALEGEFERETVQ
jgi:phage terminase small subunit